MPCLAWSASQTSWGGSLSRECGNPLCGSPCLCMPNTESMWSLPPIPQLHWGSGSACSMPHLGSQMLSPCGAGQHQWAPEPQLHYAVQCTVYTIFPCSCSPLPVCSTDLIVLILSTEVAGIHASNNQELVLCVPSPCQFHLIFLLASCRYVIHVLPQLLLCFSDPVTAVREAIVHAARVFMGQLTGPGVKLILPAMLQVGVSLRVWVPPARWCGHG